MNFPSNLYWDTARSAVRLYFEPLVWLYETALYFAAGAGLTRPSRIDEETAETETRTSSFATVLPKESGIIPKEPEESRDQSKLAVPLEHESSGTVALTIRSSVEIVTVDRTMTRLGMGVVVKGEIVGTEDLQIDGCFEGLVQLGDARLIVGASAKLTADVIAREVIVYGSVKGNLRVRDRIEIKKDAVVVGDVTTNHVVIEDGAYFRGSIEIDKTSTTTGRSDKSAITHSAAATTRLP
jgi:cytoskeletal protein CcmA (bactofilin family)